MTTKPTDSQARVTNPICGYHVEGELDAPETYAIVLELHGEAGERGTVTIECSELAMSIAELLVRAADDLDFADDHGLGALVDRVGAADDEPLTVDDILDAAPEDPGD